VKYTGRKLGDTYQRKPNYGCISDGDIEKTLGIGLTAVRDWKKDTGYRGELYWLIKALDKEKIVKLIKAGETDTRSVFAAAKQIESLVGVSYGTARCWATSKKRRNLFLFLKGMGSKDDKKIIEVLKKGKALRQSV